VADGKWLLSAGKGRGAACFDFQGAIEALEALSGRSDVGKSFGGQGLLDQWEGEAGPRGVAWLAGSAQPPD
jgi:hypothetical protein